MASDNKLEVQINWICPQCGRTHERVVSVHLNDATQGTLIGAGPLKCRECGQDGPIQVSMDNTSGLSVQAVSAMVLQIARSCGEGGFYDLWSDGARRPSDN